ncbi:MAG: cation-transporting P-type ATPase [Acidobacteria bacterium]|nr:cation-transporting P-type ATPase [Acidobacteriota bacterium]
MAEASWHSRPVTDVVQALGTNLETGLPASALALPIPGELARKSADRGPWRILRNQLTGGVILVLFAATGVMVAIGHWGDAAAILASILFAVVFGFLTDYRAEKALQALRALTSPTARAVRGGLEVEVPEGDLRPGDVLVLSAGQIIAADGRIARARDLSINESALTGESLPVEKSPEPVDAAAPLPSRTSMAYAGTTIEAGAGRLVVTAVRTGTELGRIGRLVDEQNREETPLELHVARLGKQLSILATVLSVAVTLIGILRGRPFWLMLETGVLLAIAAIPEGLPAVTTVALAAGVRRMAKANSLVRRLASVETLGSTTVICTDKTGTLTENLQRVTRVFLPDREIEVEGAGHEIDGNLLEGGRQVDPDAALQRLLEIGTLCNDARLESHGGWHVHGSLTEGALLVLARKGGVVAEVLASRFQRVREKAFTSDRKLMSVVVKDASGTLLSLVKGSPEALAALTTHVQRGGDVVPLSEGERARLLEQSARAGATGTRVLALAFKTLAPGDCPENDEAGLTWVGLAGLTDPLRKGVREAIEILHGAGVRTVMVTGDQKATALSIARELSIAKEGDLALDSTDLAALVDAKRWDEVRATNVYARVSPEDKLSIVKALRAAGEVVAMTGDGVNDAPALKAADIGIAIGKGAADVAREASDLIVTTGDYAALPAAVSEGRHIYGNIRRAVHFLLLCSLSTIGVMLVSVVGNLPLPMSPLQILWLNLVVHIFPAIALVLVPGERDVLLRPPRDPKEPLLTRRALTTIVLRSAFATAAVLWVFLVSGGRDGGPRGQTLVMATLAITILAQAFAALSGTDPFWRMGRAMRAPFWLALAGGLALQAIAVHWPALAGVLLTAPLGAADWLRALGAAAVALALAEVGKLLRSVKAA